MDSQIGSWVKGSRDRDFYLLLYSRVISLLDRTKGQKCTEKETGLGTSVE